jgi:FkbM family methyltransferase
MNSILLFFAKVINNVFGYAKGKKGYFKTWQYMHTVALQGMGRIQGTPLDESGENNVLRDVITAAGQRPVVIDVGANKGDYTAMAISHLTPAKQIELHLFEPSAFNIGMLKKRFEGHNSANCFISINHGALSDENGFAFLFSDSEGSDLGSLIDLKIPIRPFEESKKEKVQIMTFDEYASTHNIKDVDLLKIDVEGAEYKVLNGAKKMLDAGRIKNIQFEFGAGNITARIYFHDFWELLHSRYTFFQVLSDGLVPVEKYSIDLEVFKTTNYFLSLKTA